MRSKALAEASAAGQPKGERRPCGGTVQRAFDVGLPLVGDLTEKAQRDVPPVSRRQPHPVSRTTIPGVRRAGQAALEIGPRLVGRKDRNEQPHA
jgi:hypothetical protein